MLKQEELLQKLGQACVIRAEKGLDTSPNQLRVISNSIKSEYFKIWRNKDGAAIGYIAWAKINRESYCILQSKNQLPKYDYEWDEGQLTLVIDIVISTGWSGYLLKLLLEERRKHQAICYRKRKERGTSNLVCYGLSTPF